MDLGIKDDAFLRGKVPMTKEEIRILTLVKAQIASDALVYDIGAGTGSLSIEAARLAPQGHVYAIEKNPEGRMRSGFPWRISRWSRELPLALWRGCRRLIRR